VCGLRVWSGLQGDMADCMFFVEDGEIRIAMRRSVGTSRYLAYTLFVCFVTAK